jgi:hypothetical protein
LLVRDENKRLRARLAEVEAQRDALVPLAKFALLMTGGSSAFVEENDAADAALAAIAAEPGKGDLVTDTPKDPTPTTPSTAEQLRESARWYTEVASTLRQFRTPDEAIHADRAAAALDAEAARREAPHAELRRAVADYMASEGCSCCRDNQAHDRHTAELARLLNVPKYEDGSGYNFAHFKSEPTDAK